MATDAVPQRLSKETMTDRVTGGMHTTAPNRDWLSSFPQTPFQEVADGVSPPGGQETSGGPVVLSQKALLKGRGQHDENLGSAGKEAPQAGDSGRVAFFPSGSVLLSLREPVPMTSSFS